MSESPIPRPVAVHEAILQIASSPGLRVGACAALAQGALFNSKQTRDIVLGELERMAGAERLKVLFHVAVAGTAVPDEEIQETSASVLMARLSVEGNGRMARAISIMLLAHTLDGGRWSEAAERDISMVLKSHPGGHAKVLRIASEWALPGSFGPLNGILERTLPPVLTPEIAAALARYLATAVAAGIDIGTLGVRLAQSADTVPLGDSASLYVAISKLPPAVRNRVAESRLILAERFQEMPDMSYEKIFMYQKDDVWTSPAWTPPHNTSHEAAGADVQASLIAVADALVGGASAAEVERVLTLLEMRASEATFRACTGQIVIALTQLGGAAPPSLLERVHTIESWTSESREWVPAGARPMASQVARLEDILRTSRADTVRRRKDLARFGAR